MDEEEQKVLADARAAFGEHEPEVEEPTIETPTEETETVESKTEEVSNKEEKFDFKAYKKELREELEADYTQKLEALRQEYEKSKPDETVTTNLEEEITKLANEKELDPDVLKGIIDLARKGVPQDDSALKSELETLKAEREQREQQEIFNTEWNAVLPDLKKDFPNASDEQLSLAKEQLDELSHSEKYHDKDIDYVVFKEKELLAKTLFSPKKSTFESARPVTFDESDEFPDISTDMTPAQFDAALKKREAMIETMAPSKLRIMGRNASGQMEERYE